MAAKDAFGKQFRNPKTTSGRPTKGAVYKAPGHFGTLNYSDQEQYEEYGDVAGPKNLGRRKPNQEEWGDYIVEEQQHYAYGLESGEIKVPETPKRGRPKGSKNKK